MTNDIFETVPEVVEEITEESEVVEEITEEPEEYMIGNINCKNKLNLRAEPAADADVLKELNKGVEVMIYPEESTSDFYKVCTESGIEGYCMKKFVKIQ